MGQWVTIAEAAARLGKSPRTIRRWANAGKIQIDSSTPVILVDIGGASGTEPDKMDVDSLAAEVERLTTETERLEAEAGQLETEAGHLQTLVDEVRDDRDRLLEQNIRLEERVDKTLILLDQQQKLTQSVSAQLLIEAPGERLTIWQSLGQWLGLQKRDTDQG
jgi:hypothetical protein